ncbi:hypothetical protein I4U23_006416 [Adineta vaga]|nr:hypothetical protein I4U23_006416 [Adineta vaga]
MSSSQSTETIVKQLCSGLLSGSVIGILINRGHYIVSYLTFTSIGLIDMAYHFHYLKAHITHLTYDELRTQRKLRTRLTDLQRNVQRELRDTPDDVNQELQWLWSDIRRYIDRHIYFGMGFTMAFLMGIVLLPKKYR